MGVKRTCPAQSEMSAHDPKRTYRNIRSNVRSTYRDWRDKTYAPITPPSVRRMAIVAERGRPPEGPSGQELTAFGFFGSLRGGWSSGNSPGCCTLMKSVRRSGVCTIPVISQPRGPTRKRRISPVEDRRRASGCCRCRSNPQSPCCARRSRSESRARPAGRHRDRRAERTRHWWCRA